MKKSIVFIVVMGLAMSLVGQSNDSIVQNSEQNPVSYQNGLMNEIKSMTLQLDAKEKTIMRLKKDSVNMQSKITKLENRVEELGKEVANAKTTAESSKKEYETVKQAVLSKDAVLYKQCLLYPLERRYNAQLIEDALNTVEAFAGLGQMSEKFNEYRNTYGPLLMQYRQYNQQIMDSIQDCIGYIEIREKKAGENVQIKVPKDKWTKMLKSLPYYQECYIGKDKPPFKSIIYLDDVIDEFQDIIDHSGSVKSELQKLVKKLEPKKN